MDFQTRVYSWVLRCLGPNHANNKGIRGLRFLEESLELFQAVGGSRLMAHYLVDMVFAKPAGEVDNEIGGCMVTLHALGSALGTDVDAVGWKELERIDTPEMITKIRERNKTKPRGDA